MGWRTILTILAAISPLKGELLPVRTYTTADGLAADHVHCIVPDSRGFLWFCTPEGLSRFDGYHFVSYGVKEGLANAAISAVVETRGGEYFVGTAGGISRINASGPGSRFTSYAPGQTAIESSVRDLHEGRNGKLWCATTRSLSEWSRASGFRRREFPLPPKVAITSVLETADGILWIGTAHGLYRLGETGIAQTFHVPDGLPGEWVQALLADSKGGVWAAVRGGLALFSGAGGGEWRVSKVYDEKSGLVGSDVKALTEASDGTLWVGTTRGIGRLKLGGGEPALLPNLTRVQGLSDRIVIAIAEDRAGNIWAGTAGAGVMRIDRRGFTTYREEDGLATDRVFSVFEDGEGELVAVTSRPSLKGKLVNIFDGAKFRVAAPQPFKDRPSWGSNQVILRSRTGEWWAATKEGLCRYPAMKAAALDGRRPRTCYAREDSVFSVFEDSQGGIWASAEWRPGEDHLMRWDPRTEAIHSFAAPRSAGGPLDDLVNAFAEDSHGNIWMGLYNGGVYRYDGRGFRYFQKQDGMPGGLISALAAGRDGLWIASSGGGLGYVADTAEARPRVEIYDSARGLASDIVNCLVEDGEGRIYAGTTRGVDRLDSRTGYVRHFSIGLGRGECMSAVRDRAGSLWFATAQGLSRLTPGEEFAPARPRVLLTDLRVGGAQYPLSHLGETRVSRLELKPAQNQLQVEFVGLGMGPADVLRYSYKLEGADPAWSPPRSQLAVNYAALASGSYRFLVKAVTSEGVESESPAAIDFTVLPPVWQRWWFDTMAVALVAGLVFGAHRYRVVQAVNLERIRMAIATDLHDDIGSSLSQIAVLSEVARTGVNGENRRTQESLQKVAMLAREMVDSLGDIVWSIRAVPDGFDSLVSRMREFALDLLGAQGIDFELHAGAAGHGERQLSLETRRHLFLMFKECIHNASRHSGCTAVRVDLNVEDHEILLTVADNGRGFRAEKTGGGNGITGMRRRAESAGGSIEWVSRAGEGCSVSIRLPLWRGAYLFK
jgi:signal transduction histidine kinase/ligand-binding sensor domain-containing protein